MSKSKESNAPIYLSIAYFIAFTIPGICQNL